MYCEHRCGGLKSEGCRYKIADKVVKKKADYVFSLKGNQDSLHEDVQEYNA
jgi:predicted transposase YbfD/YdcC